GSGWLANHPERDLIARRYLARQRSLVADATQRLAALDDSPVDAAVCDEAVTNDAAAEPVPGALASDSGSGPAPDPARGAAPVRSMAAARRAGVLAALRRVGAHRVVDLGCGEGALLAELLADSAFTEILGVDVSARELS